jgi:hypothetical protein
VARFTKLAEFEFVGVVLFVATVAANVSILVLRRGVTLGTGDYRVLSDQGKVCQIMVENDFFAPTQFGMTLLTLFSLGSLVFVIEFMTAVAGLTGFGFVKVFLMAVVAGCFFVFTF